MNKLPPSSRRVFSKNFARSGLAGILLLVASGCSKSADPFSNGVEALNQHDYDSAIVAFSDAIHLNPNSAEAYFNRGSAYNGKHDQDKAITDFNAALRLNPNLVLAYDNLGLIYDDRHDYDKAVTAFTGVVGLTQ